MQGRTGRRVAKQDTGRAGPSDSSGDWALGGSSGLGSYQGGRTEGWQSASRGVRRRRASPRTLVVSPAGRQWRPEGPGSRVPPPRGGSWPGLDPSSAGQGWGRGGGSRLGLGAEPLVNFRVVSSSRRRPSSPGGGLRGPGTRLQAEPGAGARPLLQSGRRPRASSSRPRPGCHLPGLAATSSSGQTLPTVSPQGWSTRRSAYPARPVLRTRRGSGW